MGADDEINRRAFDRHLERLEDRLQALSTMDLRVKTNTVDIDKMKDDIAALSETRYDMKLLVKSVGQLEEVIKKHDGRLAALERIAYAMMGMYLLAQGLPALQGLLAVQ